MKVDGVQDNVPEVPRPTISRQMEMAPQISEVSPANTEVDYGNKRIEGTEKRIIDVGLGIPQIDDGASERSWRVRGRPRERPQSVNLDENSKQGLWWDRITGRQKRVKKGGAEV